jgi:hypothetical protein
VAVNPPLDNGFNVEPYYRGTCNVTAVAECCKQLCKKKPHYPKPHYSHGHPYGGAPSSSAAGVLGGDDGEEVADTEDDQAGGFKAAPWSYDSSTQQQQQQQQQGGGAKQDWYGDAAGKASSKIKGAHAGQQQQQQQQRSRNGGLSGAFMGKPQPADGENNEQYGTAGQGQGSDKLVQKARHGGGWLGAVGSVSNRQRGGPNSKSNAAAPKQHKTGSKGLSGSVQDPEAHTHGAALGQGSGDGAGPGAAYEYAGVHGVNQNAPAAPAAPSARKRVQYRQAYMAPTAA